MSDQGPGKPTYRHYQELARVILEGAIERVQCDQTTPMVTCKKWRGETRCALCREMALMYLESEDAEALAVGMGIDAGKWRDGLRHLSRVASRNNARCYEDAKATLTVPLADALAAARAYVLRHPGASWRDVWLNVSNTYISPKSMAATFAQVGWPLGKMREEALVSDVAAS